MSLLGLGGSHEAPVRCSAAGCTADADVAGQLAQTPASTRPTGVKVWLACDEHRGTLDDYLSTRGFPVRVTALDSPVDAV